MKHRKLLFAAGLVAVATLSGCAAYPYDDPYYDGYRGRYVEPGYYGPGYYTGPSVGFGITYSDRYDGYRHREYRDRDRDHDRDR